MLVWFVVVIGSFLYVYGITGEYNDLITAQALILMGIGMVTALGSTTIDSTKLGAVKSKRRTLEAKKKSLETEITAIPAQIAKLPSTDAIRIVQLEGLRATKEEELVGVKKEHEEVAKIPKPRVTDNFFLDLVKDVHGVSLHRFQMLVWTGVLAFVFGVGVYTNLAMPELDTTLLTLMGISSGTYLGFKIPEQK
jgi:hypothetical protein